MHRTSNDSSTVLAVLRSLCEGFFEDLAWLDACPVVEASQITPSSRSLLVHTDHMTATLSNHYGEPVALRVDNHIEDGGTYRRKIVLTVGGGSRVVEFGVVRLNVECVDDEVRRAIVERKTPLGEILNSHNVLTRVEPKWFVRFVAETPIAKAFRPVPAGDVFGRIGLIYCDHNPVVELLEVVSP